MSEQDARLVPKPLPFAEEESEGSVPERFARVVGHCPDWPAIKHGTQTLSYSDLDEASNRVANAILADRRIGEEPIALLLELGIGAVVAVLGVLKAGKCYVALSPENPSSHLETILQDTEAALIITSNQHTSLAAGLAREGRNVLSLDEVEAYFPSDPVAVPVSPDSLAIIFFTSGSTGKPKGVPRTHNHVVRYAWDDAQYYYLSPRDRQSLMSLPSFAGFASDTYHTLLTGGTLYPFDTRNHGLAELADWLAEEGITLFHPPVSLFGQFLESLSDEASYPKVRAIILGGQAVTKRHVELFQKHFPGDTEMLSRFVSTECGVICSLRIDGDTQLEDKTVPPGYPATDKEIIILDEDRQPLSPGKIGEIAVRSRYLAPGYWRRPDLTAEVFLPDPDGGDKRIFLSGDLGRFRSDGSLEFLGRKDFQVKVRGYRIELEAVESALHDLDGVKEAVVSAIPPEAGDNLLTAYIVPSSQPAPTVSALRNSLAKELPDYMIPSRFIMLESIPRTPTGKVDREQLRAPDQSRQGLGESYAPPQDDLEAQLVEVWEEVLGIQPIGVRDSFFDLGGHSLLLASMQAQIENRFNKRLPLASFLLNPTVELLADLLRGEEPPSALPAEADSMPAGAKPLGDTFGAGLKNRFLQVLAQYAPGGKSTRVWLHRKRGVQIGDKTWIGTAALIETAYPGLVSIGNNVTIGIRSVIIAHYRETTDRGKTTYEATVRIEDDVHIGPGVIILPNVTIGHGAVLAAGSIVGQSVPPLTMVQGNPAKVVARCGVPLKGHSYEDFISHLTPIED